MSNILDSHVTAYQGNLQYDFDNQILLNWYPKRIIEYSDNSKSLLELGLGHGYTTTIFSKHFSKHIVLDGSKAIIENFKKTYKDCNATIIETYFENYQTTEKYDLIVMGFILEHVDDPVQVLSHYKQFLNIGGKIFVAVPNAQVLNRRLGYLAGMLPDMEQLSEHDHILGHKRYYTVNTLSNEINKAGYAIKRIEGIYLKPFTTAQMVLLNFNQNIIDALCEVGIDYPELCCGILAEIAID